MERSWSTGRENAFAAKPFRRSGNWRSPGSPKKPPTCRSIGDWPNDTAPGRISSPPRPQIAYAYVDDYLRMRPDVAISDKSLDVVAKQRGVPSEILRRTVEQYNLEFARNGGDENGDPDRRQPLVDGRWVLLGPVKSFFTTTEGGVCINHSFQVHDGNGRVIPGLFAIGQNGLGGMVLWGHGLHIAWAITSGRLVGKILSAETHDTDSRLMRIDSGDESRPRPNVRKSVCASALMDDR